MTSQNLTSTKFPVQVVSNIGCYRNIARCRKRNQSRGQTGKSRIDKFKRSLLSSGCWNSNLRGRIHLASSMKLRDRDAIETAEGLIFRVFGYSHPPECLHLRRRVCLSKNLSRQKTRELQEQAKSSFTTSSITMKA